MDQGGACSFPNKGPLHGLESRGRGMAGVEGEDKVPGRTQRLWACRPSDGRVLTLRPERVHPAVRLFGGRKALGDACFQTGILWKSDHLGKS